MLAWDLEDWITDEGADALDRFLVDPGSLSAAEAAVYQIWLLDTEARNGGLSQYFCNHGRAQWEACQVACAVLRIESFKPFASALNEIVGTSEDPYEVIVQLGESAENLWYSYQPAVIGELRAAYNNAL